MNVYFPIALCLLPIALFFIAIRIVSAHQSGTVVGEQGRTVRSGTVRSGTVLFIIALALAAVLLISMIETFIPRLFPAPRPLAALLLSCFAVALIEEVSKPLVLLVLPAKRLTMGQFVLCAAIFGLSVGCFESVAYFLRVLVRAQKMGAEPVYGNILTRIFTAVSLHTFCAMLGAIFILSLRKGRAKIGSIFWAIVLHAIYDFLALNTSRRYFAYAAILLAALQCRAYYRTLCGEE